MGREAKLCIRPFLEADTAEVEALENSTSNPPWSSESLIQTASEEGSHFLVAVSNEKVQGFIGVRKVLDEAEILKLAVAPESRRQGLGQSLLHRALSEMTESGVSRMILEVRSSNRAAICLYEKNGFRPSYTRKAYYKSPTEDAIILFKEIPGS